MAHQTFKAKCFWKNPRLYKTIFGHYGCTEVGQNNMNILFKMCNTSTVQYRDATFRCRLIPRGGEKVGRYQSSFFFLKILFSKNHHYARLV